MKKHYFQQVRWGHVFERNDLEIDYRRILDIVNDAILIYDIKTSTILDANQKMCEVLGYSLQEVLFLAIEDIITFKVPYTQKKVLYLIKKAVHGEPQLFEGQLKRKEGQLFWGGINLKYLNGGEKELLLVILRDITEYKQRKETIRLLEERFLKVFISSPNAMAITTLNDGRHIDINESFCRTYGYSHEEIIGRTVSELGIWSDPKDRTKMVRMLNKEGIIQNEEFTFRTKLGEERVVLCSQVIIEGNGEPYILSEENDITERKQAEKALKESESRYRELVTSVPVVVTKLATDGTLLFVNEAIYRITGYIPYELRNDNYFDLLYPGELRQPVKELMQKIYTDDNIIDTEINLQTKNGSIKTLSWRFYKNYQPKESLDSIFGFGIDITERKQLEKEIVRLDRLNLIGEMAAGISHEIRNPLTTVRGFLELIGDKKECLSFKENFDMMITELDRANGIITEFLTLAKNRMIDLKEQNLNPIIESIFPLIQANALVSDQNVCLQLEPVPNLQLDKKEILQLILNLARNGLEAMPPGKNLTIRTFIEEKEVVLSVEDEGPGINPDLLDKIGTPFFTTKDQGTGIGLAICYSIAARHGAVIKIATSSTGTTFYVRFKQQMQ